MSANYLNINGKIWFFNVNEGSGGYYLTIVGKKNGEQVDKLTIFPSQLPSFIYTLISTLQEIREKEGVTLDQFASSGDPTEEEIDRDPDEGFPMDCPYCDTQYEKGSISPTGNTCWVMCVECGKSIKGNRAEGRDLAQRLHKAGAQ